MVISCPSNAPAVAAMRLIPRQLMASAACGNEGFAAQWGDAATRRHSVVRVARAGNVRVIIEDATLDDHYYYWLAQAVYMALPQYTWHPGPNQPTRR